MDTTLVNVHKFDEECQKHRYSHSKRSGFFFRQRKMKKLELPSASPKK